MAGWSGAQMKKLLVEFICELKYSSLDNKVEVEMNKYPILMDIVIIFLRKYLTTYAVVNSYDFLQPV